MGLGKTLSVLALICSSLDARTTRNIGNESRSPLGTLIIAPKSSRIHHNLGHTRQSSNANYLKSHSWLARADIKVGKQEGKLWGLVMKADHLTCRHIHKNQIKAAIYHGPKRESCFSDFVDTDIIITTYETVRSDFAAPDGTRPLHSRPWLRIVLDEGK